MASPCTWPKWPFVVDEKTGEDTELGRVLVDDPALVDAMEKVREVVSGTLSLRKAAKIRVRHPSCGWR